jgi:hypothetical protein
MNIPVEIFVAAILRPHLHKIIPTNAEQVLCPLRYTPEVERL